MNNVVESAILDIQQRYNVWSDHDTSKLREYLHFLLTNKKINESDIPRSADHFALWRVDCLNAWLTGTQLTYTGT